MHAIRMSPETFDKIVERDLLNRSQIESMKNLFLYKDYVFITGYVPEHGEMEAWTLMPFFVFRDHFDYDAEKITHDWDQIVRLKSDGDSPRLPYKE